MKFIPYFLHYLTNLDNVYSGDVHKFLLISNEYCLNQHSETHTLLVGVNKVLFVLSAFIVNLDEIWLYVI